MTIWILALLCVGLAGYAGFARGAIRVAMSLIGILAGLIFAPILGPMLAPLMRKMIANALLADAIAPFVVFLLITVAFKLLAQAVHSKIEVYFKYKETDTRLLHWERVMARMGAGLGILNGTLYFYVLCTAFYVAGYLTTQIAMDETATFGSKLINRVAADINSSGMDKAIVAIDPMPDSYYDAADILGQLQHNPLLISRLRRYPAFLSLAERPEAQVIATDIEVQQLIQTAPIMEVLTNPKVKALMENPSIVDELKTIDVGDLKTFVETGESPKYQPTQILGRWDFDHKMSMEQSLLADPSMRSRERQSLSRQLSLAFSSATFTATPDNQAFVKAIQPPPIAQPGEPIQPFQPGPPVKVLSGNWSESNGAYGANFMTVDSHIYYEPFKGNAKVRFLNDSLFLEFEGAVLAFQMGL